jgi:hypothetical protein
VIHLSKAFVRKSAFSIKKCSLSDTKDQDWTRVWLTSLFAFASSSFVTSIDSQMPLTFSGAAAQFALKLTQPKRNSVTQIDHSCHCGSLQRASIAARTAALSTLSISFFNRLISA